MNNPKRVIRQLNHVKEAVRGAGRAIVAGTAGAALAVGHMRNMIQGAATRLRGQAGRSDKSEEVVEMKKSTLVALFVFLAGVAGVLGALYMYVLRREKELDEYEQLLFSEDFADDMPPDGEDLDMDLMDDEIAADEEKA